MKKILTLALIVVLALPLFAQGKERIYGNWYNGKKVAMLEIFPLRDGTISGKLIWLKEPLTEDGKEKTDSKNPDAKLRKKPMIGLSILSGLVYDGKGKYSKGKIYDPESGKSYSAKAEMVDNNTLALRGYIGISLAGRTETWTRAPEKDEKKSE
ncbi:MAG TPA: DUF2147 domain-containing protein [Candidatus Cloacimonetes bacterium]|nr:DUF2147 domain-containing protein [Candidatus Cloacimonadota bacterium]